MKARKYVEQNRVAAFVGFTLILVLVIGLAIIIPLGIRGGAPATKPTPTPTTGVVTPTPSTGVVTPTPTTGTKPTPTPTPGESTPTPIPGVVLGPQACPDTVKDPAHWRPFLTVPPDTFTYNPWNVTCGYMLGKPSLQAMVVAREIIGGSPTFRSVFVFDKITDPKPQLLFKVGHLLNGDAQISVYSTILTKEVDINSSINKDKPGLTTDLFREFQWSDKDGTFVQVAFPGIFPDLTRWEADDDQIMVNQGKDTWKNDPKQVAQKLAVKFFGWNRPLTATVISGGGAKDVYATVKVEGTPFPSMKTGPSVNVILSRLEGNTHNMWVAIAVEGGPPTNIEARSLVASPVKIEGKGGAYEGLIGHAYILDHLYTTVGQSMITALPGLGMGESPYSILVSYDTSFKQGPQEGIVETAMSSPVGGPYTMVKVLLDSQPRVAQGPVSCPLALQKEGYWDPILGIDPNVSSLGTVSCGNLKGDPSLQALVPVYHPASQTADIYVYDHITDAHPVQIFKLPGLIKGSAMVSGYSTVMTAEVDMNSSINKGKNLDQMTVDLFREFQWSGKTKTFEQVAFPGIFPDLTRWEAERDQNQVTIGKDGWKNDPKQVAQRLAAKFFGWNRPLKATVISGGGAKDVYATVKVEETPVQGMKSGPSVNVRLSRLGGNTHNMWVAIAVEDDSALTLTTIKSGSLVASPVKLEGKGDAFENTIGMAYILDHLYTTVGQGLVTGASGVGWGNVPYSIQVSYDTSFKQGPQEGVVEVLRDTPIESHPYSIVMVKVLLDPQPRVAQGPVSCPIALQVPGYWEKVLGIDSATGGVGTVDCGNLKGDPSLQALVPVYYTNGKPGHIDVYDRITDAHPVRLFSLQTGSALISGYSTIMTSDNDLYREFQWSAKAGTFVQVAFPGIFPELTR